MNVKTIKSGASALLILSLFLSAGCISPLPNKTFVRLGPSYKEKMPAVDRVGLLVDGLVAYHGASRFFVVEDSRAAITNLMHETETDLRAKGYDLAFTEAPFVGGFLHPNPSSLVALRWADKPEDRKAPFQINESSNDPAYQDALLTTLSQVLLAVEKRGNIPTADLQSSPSAKAALSAIAAKKQIRYLFVVHGNGVVESTGKQVAQAVGTAVVSSVLTLGLVSISSHNVSFLDSYVSLIDLQNDEVIWCNSLRLNNLNPTKPGNYKASCWARNVLYWFPPRGKLNPPRR